jgi:hypothetical protein
MEVPRSLFLQARWVDFMPVISLSWEAFISPGLNTTLPYLALAACPVPAQSVLERETGGPTWRSYSLRIP